VEVEHDGDLAVSVAENRIERLSLWQRAREAVEDEAVHRVRLREALAHDLDGQVVRDELTRVHVGLHLRAQRAPRPNRGPVHVARVDVRNTRLRRDELRLGALAGPWGA
jgi:hypothetical protein